MTGILSYSATFLLGLLHAFEPGHGKSILAAFSLKETNLKTFGSLILSLFVSHFLVLALFAWGLQTLSSTAWIARYSESLELLSPILVIAFGGYLLYKIKKERQTVSGCSCGHDHTTDVLSNMKTASITGLMAGLMPCPTAIAPLVVSGLHDGFNTTLMHILIYVTGMTLALFSFTTILLVTRSFFQKQLKFVESKVNLSMLSAVVMIGIGVVYLTINIAFPDAHH